MCLEKKIIDYKENKKYVDNWIVLKGRLKYEQFVNLLENKNIEITWKNLDDLVRYDKRLLVNIFKYLSFYEDFLRAIIYNTSSISYKKIENSYLNFAIEEVLKIKVKLNEINLNILSENKNLICKLRNWVSHNKIMINFSFEEKNLNQTLNVFKEVLPISHQNGFMKDIRNCCKNLNIPKEFKIFS